MADIDLAKLIVYFVAGIVQDFFFTLNTKYVAENKIFPAIAFSFLTVLMSMLVLYNILSSLDSERGLLAIFIYSCGIAIGTFAAMKLPKFKKRK